MAKVTITALPRQGGHRGFGAIERYFVSGVPEQIDVSDAEYKELQEDPAKFFLKVEDGWKEPATEATIEPAPKSKK